MWTESVYIYHNINYTCRIQYTRVSVMKKIKQSETLADQAYQMIKQAIVQGKLKDKELLPEEKLAKDLGISRTPLRDALRRLGSEGLIIHETGRPAMVASFTKEDSLEYMEIRSLLEVYNIEKIFSEIDDAFIEQLKQNATEQYDAILRNHYNDFIDLDRDFHLLLASKNSNRELQKTIHRMNTGTNRAFLILSKTVPKSAKNAHVEHLEIIEALEERDFVLARNKMMIHMTNVQERFLTYYEEDTHR